MILSIPPSIQCQTDAACRLITRVTGDTLRAIHLYGSAVAGGRGDQINPDCVAGIHPEIIKNCGM